MSEKTVKTNTNVYRCSFCQMTSLELKGAMVAGPGVCICQECVLECVRIVFENNAKSEQKLRGQS